MSKLGYVEGDLFAPVLALQGERTILIPHVCNDAGAWGAGFVVPLGKQFPEARERYLKWAASRPGDIDNRVMDTVGRMVVDLLGGLEFKLGNTQVIQVREGNPRIVVANMVAQHKTGMPRPLRYNALARCMDAVADYALDKSNPEVHCPLFGAVLAGGNWNFIEQLVNDCWLRRGLPVTVYYLPGTLPENFSPAGEV